MNMPYTPKAEKQLKHLFNLVGIRIIPGYFLEHNPEKFQQWHYNACNQTALITAVLLSKLLQFQGKNNSNPFSKDYFDVEIFEGIFTEDDLPGTYNHAYLFAHQTGDAQGHAVDASQAMCFFIDVGRISNPTVFKMGYGLSDLPVSYSNNYQLHAVKKLDLVSMLYNQPEYYTAKKGVEIAAEIDVILRKLGFDLTNFNWKA